MLRTLIRILLFAALAGVVGYLGYRVARLLPPRRWLWLAATSAQMRRAIAVRNHIARMVADRGATPDGVGMVVDADDLVGSVAELVAVRGGLHAEQRRGGGGQEAAQRLGLAIGRADDHLSAALQRLEELRACLVELAADRMEERLAEARSRFRDRADQVGYTVEAHRELQEELRKLRDRPGGANP